MDGKPASQIRTFKDLIIWQKSMKLAKAVYSATAKFPSEERFGLAMQLRRCSVSVPSNIAEGYGRGHRGEYVRFLTIARGSLCELETQVLLAKELEFLTPQGFQEISDMAIEVDRLMSALLRKVKQ